MPELSTRRQIFALAALSSLLPFATSAQPKRPLVAVLWHGTEERELSNPFFGWVVQGFEEVGLRPGENISLQHYFADESDARYNTLAPELVALRPDVLVGIAGPPTFALKKAHGLIPLVFIGGSDPIATGMIQNLGKRNEEITGTTAAVELLIQKRFHLLKEAVPSLSHVGVIVNPKTAYQTDLDLHAAASVSQALGLSVTRFDIAEPDDAGPAFSKMKASGVDGVVLSQTPLFPLIRKELANAALSVRLPVITFSDTFVQVGAFASYGPVYRDVFTAGGRLVRRILEGEKASEIPIVRPIRFELVLNTKTTEALGLSPPARFVAQVDRFVE